MIWDIPYSNVSAPFTSRSLVANIMHNAVMRGHESSTSKDDDLKLMWFIDQAGGRTNLSVYGRFFEVAPGECPNV